MIIRLYEPYFTSTKIFDQLRILCAHVPGPKNFGSINIRVVKNPLVKNEIVVRTIAHNHQVVAGRLFKLAENACSFQILRILRTPRTGPTWLWFDVNGGRSYAKQPQYPADERNCTYQE